MSFEDEQNLLILAKIYQIDRAHQIAADMFRKIFEETFGGGWEKIFERLEKEGTIQGKDGGNYYTTIPGISKYLKLDVSRPHP